MYKRQEEEEEGNNRLSCTLCPNQDFPSLSDYLDHIRCHSRSFYGGSLGAISGGAAGGSHHVKLSNNSRSSSSSHRRPVATCGVCGNQFSRRTSMKRHCLNVHKMDETQFQAMMDKKEDGGGGGAAAAVAAVPDADD